jgi:predicted nucleic acid-binding protein
MAPGPPLYLETSAALRAVLEGGTTPEIEARIAAAPLLATSRLSFAESARALLRIRQQGGVAESRATFLLARRRIEGLELLTADERLRQASGP